MLRRLGTPRAAACGVFACPARACAMLAARVIKYIGSKRLLVPRIVELAVRLPRVHSALDLFSGTSRVGHALKRAGLAVTANDHTAYAHALARCYVAADRAKLAGQAERLIAEL